MVNPAALMSAKVIFKAPLSFIYPLASPPYCVNTPSNFPGVIYWERPAMSGSTNNLNISSFLKIKIITKTQSGGVINKNIMVNSTNKNAAIS